jgi:hypothetical protein
MPWGKIISHAVKKGLIKGLLKAGVKTISRPLVLCIDAVEAVVCIAQGDFIGAGITVAFAVADTATFGGATVAKEIGKEMTKVANEVVVEVSKDIAKSATVEVAKEATVEVAKEVAKEATVELAKETTKEVAKNVGKSTLLTVCDIAWKIMTETVKYVPPIIIH